VLGQEHPDTLTSMANLASTYRNQAILIIPSTDVMTEVVENAMPAEGVEVREEPLVVE
jgi:hypothetical protein